MFKGVIYRHWIVNNEGVEKSYIGLHTSLDYDKQRWGKNGNKYKKDQPKFEHAIKKYGWNNFHHDIIGYCESDTKTQLKRDLGEWEKYYIEKYDSYNNGYNGTKGGDGVDSETLVKRWKDESFRDRINKTYDSEEYKQKQSKSQKALWENEEHRDKMRKAHLGKQKGEKSGVAKKIICLETYLLV